MYLAAVLLLMLVLPLASLAIDIGLAGSHFSVALLGKWFVIWSVGARLSLAGLKQITQPAYTARTILSLKSDESLVVVRELGFGNLAIGLVGLGGTLFPPWIPAGALAGGVFYLLAGINHLRQAERNSLQNVAMVSDLAVGAILLAAFAGMLL
jgi:hypothetical protein